MPGVVARPSCVSVPVTNPVLRPRLVGIAGVHACVQADLALLASLPFAPECDVEWLPCPCELPEVASC
jgi:hypothetical protein